MKKKIIVTFSIVAFLIIIGICLYFRDDVNKVTHHIYPIYSDNEEKKLIEDNEEIAEEIESNKTESKKEIKKEENISNNNQKVEKQNDSKKDTKTNSNKTLKKEETKKENKSKETNSNQDSGIIDSNGNAVKEEKVVVVKKEPWESAGVTEYEWYHNPVYSWMRVDYPVSSCGSVSKCESLCMSDAEELSYTENVSCIQVHTYSGNYLGEMLKRD